MMYKKSSVTVIALIVIAAFFSSCNKDESDGNSTLQVRLTDNPVAFQQVNVDIREVRVKFSDDVADEGWVNLTTTAGVYDLLKLQGVDTALATGLVPSKTIKQIRFILGPNNTRMDNGTVYPLVVPSGSESGLKINIDKSLRAPLETLVMDFDAALSVTKEGTGDYKLRPVIKVK